MNNELGRKITSLTLMTIMIAGGLTFAIPGTMPAAYAANANLFVSAENSQFDNYMSGPQVIEVVIIDSDINDTDEAKGEPDVTVNGKILRMVQAVDGNWYGYFADLTQARTADANSTPDSQQGLDFGEFCTPESANVIGDVDFSDSNGVAFPTSGATGASEGLDVLGTCTATGTATSSDAGIIFDGLNVVREPKDVNTSLAGAPLDTDGQIGINVDFWPFVQLYNLNPTGNVVIQYNKGGGVQTTTLTFDTVDQFAELELDRAKYPTLAQVHATVTDLWLNIDPTDEDSWTWGANPDTPSTFYQVFDENGGNNGDDVDNLDISGAAGDLMCEDNCVVLLDTDAQNSGNDVITIQDNDDTDVIPGLDSEDPDAVTTTTLFATPGQRPVTLTEQGPNSGVFGTYDESDTSVLRITDDAARGNSASLDYNETPTTVLVGFGFGEIDIQPITSQWSSGEEIPVVLVDSDANKNSRADEDLDLNNPFVELIPALATGDPFTLGEGTDTPVVGYYLTDISTTLGADTPGVATTSAAVAASANATAEVQSFSERAIITPTSITPTDSSLLVIELGTTALDLRNTINDAHNISGDSEFRGTNLLNYDIRALNDGTALGDIEIYLVSNSTDIIDDASGALGTGLNFTSLANVTSAQGLESLNNSAILNNNLFGSGIPDDATIGIAYQFATFTPDNEPDPIVTDFFSFGFSEDGTLTTERTASQIIRIELEEDADNSSTFVGSLEYTMINQLNILDDTTYEGLGTIADDPSFIVIEDLTDEDAPRVNYFDLGADGVSTQIADQEEAPSHSGIVSFDLDTYKVADTVTVNLVDPDLNVDSDLIDIFTTVSDTGDVAFDAVGLAGLPGATRDGDAFSFGALGRLLDITFDDEIWANPSESIGGTSCANNIGDFDGAFNLGLGDTGFTLIETEIASGSFLGDFQIPNIYCQRSDADGGDGEAVSVTGTDIEVNYVDFRDASGEIIEVGDSAGVRANTGSVSLDRTVYPVPWGELADFGGSTGASTPASLSVFPIHVTGVDGNVNDDAETLGNGDLQIHVRINDPDFDISASGEDVIAQDVLGETFGPLKITVSRGADVVTLAYAGGATAQDGTIDVGDDNADATRHLGEIVEIAPDAAIFELDFDIRYTDGPASTTCPETDSFVSLVGSTSRGGELTRFDEPSGDGDYCILQGDIITVEYNDPTDASGDPNTVTDSATFDLRNGVLQSDKSVYIIGGDMILTVIEPDWDLDNDAAETYDLDVIEWDSDAATITMGDAGGEAAAFDPEPTDFRETGDSTGIFQIVIEIPEVLAGDRLERGEEIILEYTDWGPSGSDYVGQEDEDVNVTLFTSNFGATVELDQKVYSWTDKVYVTVVAPDHNFDSDLIDEIGDSSLDPIKIATRGNELDEYKLVETGTDTGIFTGEVILTGFSHDADGDESTGDDSGFDTNPRTGNSAGTTSIGLGPTDGFLEADDDDGVTVSFEFSEDETVVGSALIRWNIGEVQWLEASYPASGTGVLRVVDPDMNLDPEAVDNFDVDVWSDSDAGGIDLTVTETNEATGIFEGTVFFTVTDESSGHRLRVSEGDTITGEYEDNTLPDPYTTADELDITATSLIGTIVPPLERAPASSLRAVDSFGNTLDTVNTDQQVQVAADLANGQDKDQAFAYIVQIQDGNGVTVSLAWIAGSLSPGQSFSPSVSWTPTMPGTYTATAFVWESIDNPTALSPPSELTVTVN